MPARVETPRYYVVDTGPGFARCWITDLRTLETVASYRETDYGPEYRTHAAAVCAALNVEQAA